MMNSQIVPEQRDYQDRIFNRAVDYINSNEDSSMTSIMIESPTGSGKTVITMRIASHLSKLGHKIGWVAHRKELLQQAINTNNRFYGIDDIEFISLFTRHPEKYADRDVIIVDECLPGDATLHVIHDGKKIQTTIDEVVNNKIGTHVLSRNTDKLEYNKILNRSPMGRKEIYEVVIQTATRNHVLSITAEGRVFADGKYRKTSELQEGMQVEILASDCNNIQTGSIVEVRKTGRFTETYDIGVDKVHNFYADGILVHNCQHDASKTASFLHEAIKPKIIIGLSATPYRTDRAQLCFERVIRDAGIHQLIREGYLAEFKQCIINDEWTPEIVADTFLEDPDKWGKSVIYFHTRDEAEACYDILAANDIKAGCIRGDKPRNELITKFLQNELQVLTNVMVLTEGFDCEDLKSVFVRPASRGPTIQMAGRGFRIHPTTPFIHIIQSAETKFPFSKHARPLEQHQRINGKWRSISPKDLVPLFRSQIDRISKISTNMPDFIVKKTGKKNIFGDIMGK